MKMDDIDKGTVHRILDANANRCAEGLRVIEELARFARKDETLQRSIKRIRHEVREAVRSFGISLLKNRDSVMDVGRTVTSRAESDRDSLDGVAQANFSRVQEALRVLEEYGKLIDTDVSARFKALRFEIYTAQREFGLEGSRWMRLPPAPFLYAILDRPFPGPDSLEAVLEALLEGGVGVVQYRAKEIGPDRMREELERVLDAARSRPVSVIVNDDPSLALETGAHGVHLGRDDPSVEAARALLGPKAIIGATVHSMPEFEDLILEAVDYIAVGSIFESPTKQDVPVCGLGFLGSIRRLAAGLPIVAIGGINTENIDSVLDAGADGIALVSALLQGDIRKNCFTFRKIIDRRSD
ncbi:MAG: thiamine phosphate synthase [Candidatus Krumholzibacteria bacterium]|nr:thiamine phosphate synthase [Candidatus Krumholzibacteria bacterium]